MILKDDTPELGAYPKPYPQNPAFMNTTNTIQKGLIINFEGLDGSGKSTQSKMLCETLKSMGYKVHYVNFIHSEFIKNILLRAKWKNADPYTMALLYTMGLTFTFNTEIAPKLEAGYIVILDRYIYSIMARALVKKVNIKWINTIISHFRKPDIEILVDSDVTICLNRKLSKNEILSYWECGCDLLSADSARYEYNVEEYKKNFLKYQLLTMNQLELSMSKNKLVFDGSKEKQIIHSQILAKVVDVINDKYDK